MAIQSNFPVIKPSLLLDFANTKQLDPRITFTRASTATYYNGVTTAKAEENLFSYSQDFSNAYWVKTVTTITANATTAPDGTSTASSFPAITSGTLNALTSGSTVGASGQPLIISIFAKANTASFLQITPATAILASSFANFDLSTGTAGSIAGTGLTSSITSVGNGWYRCVVTIASASGSGAIVFSLVDSNTSARQSAYTGTAGNNIFIWGAQAEPRSVVTAYTATTTQAITNYIPQLLTAASGVARFNHNPTTDESLGLLIEEQRTNLLTYSEQFDNAAWTKSDTTVTANTLVAPDGTLTADSLIENTATANHRIFQSVSKAASAITYTATVYAKTNGRNIRVSFDSGSTSNSVEAGFNLTTGTVSVAASVAGTYTSASATITPVGNGFYRCSVTATTGTETTVRQNIWLLNDTTQNYTGNGWSGIYIWGAQLEVGAFATSYIPTVASQVTRSADAASMTGTNFSSWFSQSEGSFYGEASSLSGSAFRSLLRAVDNSTANNYFEIGLVTGTNNGVGRFQVNSNGTSQWDTGNASTPAFVANTFYKVIAGSKVNDFAGSRDSGTVVTDTAGTVANNLATFEIGGRHLSSANLLNGTIKKIAYYPMRVTNANLQALTS